MLLSLYVHWCDRCASKGQSRGNVSSLQMSAEALDYRIGRDFKVRLEALAVECLECLVRFRYRFVVVSLMDSICCLLVSFLLVVFFALLDKRSAKHVFSFSRRFAFPPCPQKFLTVSTFFDCKSLSLSLLLQTTFRSWNEAADLNHRLMIMLGLKVSLFLSV